MPRHLLPLLACTCLAAIEVEPTKLVCQDASPMDPGTGEIAVGGSHHRATAAFDDAGGRLDRGGLAITRELNASLTYGLVEDIDAGAALAWWRVSDQAADPDRGQGLTDLALNAKWRCAAWTGDDATAALAFIPTVVAPFGRSHDNTDDLPTASRHWTAGLALAGCGNWGRLAWNADVGWNQALGDAETREGYCGTFYADAALGWQLTDWFQPEVDLGWLRDRMDEGDAARAVLGTLGCQCTFAWGRFAGGVQRVLAGRNTDATTSFLATLTLGF